MSESISLGNGTATRNFQFCQKWQSWASRSSPSFKAGPPVPSLVWRRRGIHTTTRNTFTANEQIWTPFTVLARNSKTTEMKIKDEAQIASTRKCPDTNEPSRHCAAYRMMPYKQTLPDFSTSVTVRYISLYSIQVSHWPCSRWESYLMSSPAMPDIIRETSFVRVDLDSSSFQILQCLSINRKSLIHSKHAKVH